MTLSNKPYKGTRDLFPKDKRILDYLFSKMRVTAESFGFEPYDGPLLEEVDLYRAKSGEEIINEQIYFFHDRGKREVAIRPEMTPTLARMISQIHRESPRPIRWYSIPNLMRYERPQKGRLREHWQFNADFFGELNCVAELEILALGINLLKSFGASKEHFCLNLNHRAFVDYFIAEKLSLKSNDALRLYKIIDQSKKETPESLLKMIQELNLDSSKIDLLNQYLQLNNFEDLSTFCSKLNIPKNLWDVDQLLTLATKANIIEYLVYDPAIVRGFDYYTGIVFEIFDKHPENKRAIAGGGSYANLLQIFGEQPLAGIGFGLGDVTLKDFLEAHKLLPDFSHSSVDVLVSYQSSNAMGQALSLHLNFIEMGLKSFLLNEETKLKKLFPAAEKKNINNVVIIGEQEIEKKIISIKKLSDRTQKDFTFDHIQEMVKFIRGL
jgi:histidyl-tRNA synthetase